MFDLDAYLLGGACIFAALSLAWVISLWRRDASVADPTWPLTFLFAAVAYAFASTAPQGPRTMLMLALVTLWSLRLGGYLLWRNVKENEEDRRYRAMRAKAGPAFWWRSLITVFWLQAALAWVVSLPLLAGADGGPPLGWLDWLGVTLWVVGMIFEAGGDWQLARFKAAPANQSKVLDSGLWRYTRHPNYFGDFCVWWGFFALAAAAGGWWSLPAPLLMSVLLLKVSGVTLLESDIADRRSEYAAYKQRTNAFFPGLPKS
ncbi:MAG: DUF1295 domain-containing protein [Acidobacteriota bacterium]